MLDDKNAGVVENMRDVMLDISEWIRFLEAKHAGFIAADIAIIVVLLDKTRGNENWIWYLVIVLLLLDMLPSIYAEIPFMNQVGILVKHVRKYYNKKQPAPNSLFYISIFVHSQHDLEKFRKDYIFIMGEKSGHIEKLENDYLSQIIELSKVASIKTYLFYIAIRNLGIILLLLLLLVIVLLVA